MQTLVARRSKSLSMSIVHSAVLAARCLIVVFFLGSMMHHQEETSTNNAFIPEGLLNYLGPN